MDDNNDTPISEDDWGAAIAEQEKADANAAANAASSFSASTVWFPAAKLVAG